MRTTDQAATVPWCGPAPSPAALLTTWTFDPLLLLSLFAALILGLRQTDQRGIFLLAWGVLVIAFVSPLCALTTALFSARALHHLLLVSIAAPALALSLPLRGLRLSGAGAAVLTAMALVLWHVPEVYRAAWDSVWVYWSMQFALVLPAWALWSQVFAAKDGDAGALLGHAALVGALAGAMGLIGAVLTFADRILYPEHLASTELWGLTPLADQQLAGLMMWVPGLLPLAVIAAGMVRRAWTAGQTA